MEPEAIKLIKEEYIIYPNEKDKWDSNDNISNIKDMNIYQKIEEKYNELKEKGIETEKINDILEEEVKKNFSKIF